jgi:hypothetical protein
VEGCGDGFGPVFGEELIKYHHGVFRGNGLQTYSPGAELLRKPLLEAHQARGAGAYDEDARSGGNDVRDIGQLDPVSLRPPPVFLNRALNDFEVPGEAFAVDNHLSETVGFDLHRSAAFH